MLEDALLALRRLRSRPAFLLGIVVMLVIGIAVSTIMFALSDPFLSRPLPFYRPDGLVLIDINTTRFAARSDVSPDYPFLSDWQSRTELFDGLAAFVRRGTLRAQLSDRIVALEAIAVSSNIFDVLGVKALPPETPAAFDDEVWLTSHAISGPFGGAGYSNSTLVLRPSGVLQVRDLLPASFVMPEVDGSVVDALIELGPSRVAVSDGLTTTRLTLIGRLRQGVKATDVQAALNADASPRRFSVTVAALSPALQKRVRPLASGALLSGLLVLVVCTANTFGLALTRGLHRAREVATIEILGAGRLRIARLFFFEAIWLAVIASACSLMAVQFVCDGMAAMIPSNLTVLGAPSLSFRVSQFGGLAGLLVCTAWWTGSVAAWRASNGSLRQCTSRDGPFVRSLRFGLTAAQVCVTLIFLSGAALLGRSYLKLVTQDIGLGRDTLALSVSYGAELTGARLRETVDRTTDELRRLPGIRSASAVVGEMADDFRINGIVVVGRPAAVELLWVSPEYFETAEMVFVKGRALLDSDAGPHGVVINEALVSQYLSGIATVGDLLQVGGAPSPIIGIVRDSRRSALDKTPRPTVFRVRDDSMPNMRVTYLTRGETAAAGSLERAIQRVSSDALVLDASTLWSRLSHTIQNRSFATLIVSIFAFGTIAVTTAGIFGVVGYSVARRTREIGIRIAIGASRRSVVWLAMRDAWTACAVGVAVGLTVVILLSHFVSSLLFEVSATDWISLATATVAMVGSVAVAAFAPARRAGRLLPTIALRDS